MFRCLRPPAHAPARARTHEPDCRNTVNNVNNSPKCLKSRRYFVDQLVDPEPVAGQQTDAPLISKACHNAA